jgi:hypothetical protein
MPEEAFDIIYDEIKEFIIFGPAHYKDDRWDLKLLTLNYHTKRLTSVVQLLQKYMTIITQQWIHVPVDLSKTRIFESMELKCQFTIHMI